MGKRVVGFVQVRGAIACRVGVAGTSQNHSVEGYAIEGSPRDAMSAILAKSRENEFSGLRKSWGVSLSDSLLHFCYSEWVLPCVVSEPPYSAPSPLCSKIVQRSG